MSDEARGTGPSRLHVPGQAPPGTPEFRYQLVKDTHGNSFAMPFVYAASMDENFAKQIYTATRNAVADAGKDIIVGLCAMIVNALRPKNVEPTEAEKQNAGAAPESEGSGLHAVADPEPDPEPQPTFDPPEREPEPEQPEPETATDTNPGDAN
jgi:hypothetical protein